MTDTHETLTRPDQDDYEEFSEYLADLENYADSLEDALRLERRANSPEVPQGTLDDIARLKETVRQLTGELAGAQTRLAAIGLLLR